MDFSATIINWYNQNKRDLPWRNTKDAYKIWLSEIILQQTRVGQGLPYYLSFAEHFPTVVDLANADEQKILKLWQGLGYYSRARNLHYTAKMVVETYKASFPQSYDELLQLKGIGSYTAAAIASFSSNEPVAVVDGNVFRVLSRIFNIELDIAQASTKNYFKELAENLMDKAQPSLFNQALMEFGALQCVPKSPDCSVCVFNDRCEALKYKKVTLLPIKSKKIKIKKRYFNFILIQNQKEAIAIEKREHKDIWKNLYQLPLIETQEVQNTNDIILLIKEKFALKTTNTITYYSEYDVLHKLSHQELHLKFFRLELSTSAYEMVSMADLKTFPFPIVLHNFLEKIVK